LVMHPVATVGPHNSVLYPCSVAISSVSAFSHTHTACLLSLFHHFLPLHMYLCLCSYRLFCTIPLPTSTDLTVLVFFLHLWSYILLPVPFLLLGSRALLATRVGSSTVVTFRRRPLPTFFTFSLFAAAGRWTLNA